uniref:Uncharacterized protein n=1 Tax=Brassica oleracea var. oleracea TaxID=109376 RepID=A0A0D3DKV7_BRAOL
MQISSYMDVLDDHQHVEASQRGLRFRDEVDKGPTEAALIDTDQMPSNDTTYAILNDINKLASIDATTSPSIDTGRVLEKKELDEELEEEEKDQGRFSIIIDCSLLRWCQEIQRAQQMLLTAICKASSTPIAEIIDKGEESMEEAFTQE